MQEISKINLEEMITLPQAAQLMGFTEPYVRRLVRAGRIAGFKFGRNYLVHKQSAMTFEKSPGCGRPKTNQRPKC